MEILWIIQSVFRTAAKFLKYLPYTINIVLIEDFFTQRLVPFNGLQWINNIEKKPVDRPKPQLQLKYDMVFFLSRNKVCFIIAS